MNIALAVIAYNGLEIETTQWLLDNRHQFGPIRLISRPAFVWAMNDAMIWFRELISVPNPPEWLIITQRDLIPPSNFLDIIKHSVSPICGWALQRSGLASVSRNFSIWETPTSMSDQTAPFSVKQAGIVWWAINRPTFDKLLPHWIETTRNRLHLSEEETLERSLYAAGITQWVDPTIRCRHERAFTQ